MSKTEEPETRIETFTEINDTAAEGQVEDPLDTGDRVIVDHSELLDGQEDNSLLDEARAKHGTIWEVVESWVEHTTRSGETGRHHVYERRYLVVPTQKTTTDNGDSWQTTADRLAHPENHGGEGHFYYDNPQGQHRMLVSLPNREDFPGECACCGSNKAIDHYNDLSSQGGLDCAVCGYRIRDYSL